MRGGRVSSSGRLVVWGMLYEPIGSRGVVVLCVGVGYCGGEQVVKLGERGW